MNTIEKHIIQNLRAFNENPTRKHMEYILTYQTIEERIFVSKTSEFTNDPFFTVRKDETGFTVITALDNAQEEILQSLQDKKYNSIWQFGYYEFAIPLQNEEEVISFLETHFWSLDLGRLY